MSLHGLQICQLGKRRAAQEARNEGTDGNYSTYCWGLGKICLGIYFFMWVTHSPNNRFLSHSNIGGVVGCCQDTVYFPV